MIDSYDIKEIHLRTLRSHIALVGQEPTLFAGTIRENILYGRDNATEAEIIEAAKAANAFSFIRYARDRSTSILLLLYDKALVPTLAFRCFGARLISSHLNGPRIVCTKRWGPAFGLSIHFKFQISNSWLCFSSIVVLSRHGPPQLRGLNSEPRDVDDDNDRDHSRPLQL